MVQDYARPISSKAERGMSRRRFLAVSGCAAAGAVLGTRFADDILDILKNTASSQYSKNLMKQAENYMWEEIEYYNPRAELEGDMKNISPWPYIEETFTKRLGKSTVYWRDMITEYNRTHDNPDFSWGRMYNGKKYLAPVEKNF